MALYLTFIIYLNTLLYTSSSDVTSFHLLFYPFLSLSVYFMNSQNLLWLNVTQIQYSYFTTFLCL